MPNRIGTQFNNGGNAMWDQYKKSFFGMQVVISLVTVCMYLLFTRQWAPAAMFFLTMQVASVLGAFWGQRLRNRMRGRAW
jgi:uncharacterized membrane protein YfcA